LIVAVCSKEGKNYPAYPAGSLKARLSDDVPADLASEYWAAGQVLPYSEEASAAIYRESSRLHRLVDSLLILSRFDSREYRPQLVRVDVGGLVREEAERLVEAGLAEAERVCVLPGDPVEALTDPDMFRQVVANLLRNAVQYGGEDPVEARVAVEPGTLVLEVSNGGRPLESEERARVFERFYRGWGGGRTEGFGLGLPLVREICEVLGGRIELTEPGPRTTFRVTLPDIFLPSSADPG
jgi:signal transduction histidine kinase